MGVSLSREDLSGLPRQSPDADQVLTLQANENCQFFVDGQPLVKGKRVRVIVTRDSHQLVCKPDGYRAKEEYVQPPYDPHHPIGFTFLIEDRLPTSQSIQAASVPPVVNAPPRPEKDSREEAGGFAVDTADQRGVRIDGREPQTFVQEQYGRAWAVVIGVNEYGTDIPRLKYAVPDATAVGDLLEKQGFTVARLFDRQATRNRILEVLGDELPLKVKPNDRVAIFYAGHGETKSVEGAQEMGYLLPVDAERTRLHRTSISMGEIRQLASLLPAKHVLFLVDVCYGGIAGQQFRSLPAQTSAYLRQITRERGRQLITAGGPGQQVVEGPQWGHSVFTYYLLQGLNGLADLNGDGIIPASELYAYLDGRVPAAADNQQRPELWSLAAEKGEFVFIPAAKPAQ